MTKKRPQRVPSLILNKQITLVANTVSKRTPRFSWPVWWGEVAERKVEGRRRDPGSEWLLRISQDIKAV